MQTLFDVIKSGGEIVLKHRDPKNEDRHKIIVDKLEDDLRVIHETHHADTDDGEPADFGRLLAFAGLANVHDEARQQIFEGFLAIAKAALDRLVFDSEGF